MRIPTEAVIPSDKLSRYLLVHREWDDKSQYLARVGFTIDRPTGLETAIRRVAAENVAVDDGTNEYGTFFRVAGELVGPTGGTLPVVLIWIQWKLDGTFHFVTLNQTSNNREPTSII